MVVAAYVLWQSSEAVELADLLQTVVVLLGYTAEVVAELFVSFIGSGVLQLPGTQLVAEVDRRVVG